MTVNRRQKEKANKKNKTPKKISISKALDFIPELIKVYNADGDYIEIYFNYDMFAVTQNYFLILDICEKYKVEDVTLDNVGEIALKEKLPPEGLREYLSLQLDFNVVHSTYSEDGKRLFESISHFRLVKDKVLLNNIKLAYSVWQNNIPTVSEMGE